MPPEATVNKFRSAEIKQLAHELTLAPARRIALQIDGIFKAHRVERGVLEDSYTIIYTHTSD